MFDDQNVDIFGSREEIRNQLIEYAKDYMELENVDLYKTSFLSYMINILSILSANQMYYTSTVYKEFFFIQAQLEESVYNLAKWIGYDIPTAVPSTVNVLLKMALGFQDNDVNIVFPSNFKVYANTTTFRLNTGFSLSANMTDVQSEIADMIHNGVTTRILNNSVVTVQDTDGFYYPVQIVIPTGGEVGDDAKAKFLLPFIQSEENLESFQIPLDLEFYQFYNKKLTDIVGQISDINVYVFPEGYAAAGELLAIDNVIDFYENISAEDRATYLWQKSEAGLYTLSPP